MKSLKYALLALVVLIGAGLAARLLFNIYFGFDAAAIGVIGSADGPTSVFVAHKIAPPFMVWIIIFIGALAALLAVWRFRKR